MDNSPQNITGEQQKPATENTTGDQQYLNSPYPAEKRPNSRRKIIFGAIGLVVIVVLILVGLTVQNILSKRVVACADAECFSQRFSKCLPAEYTYNEAGSSIKYAITGAQSIGCSVSVEYLKAQYLSSAVGKQMTCDFDNRLDFQTAAQNVFHYPADYACKGTLVDLFQNLNNTANTP